MSVLTGSVVAGTSATLLYANKTTAFIDVMFTTHGNSADVYVGGPTVTPSSNGVVFAKSLVTQLRVPAGETLYCAGNGADIVKWQAFA